MAEEENVQNGGAIPPKQSPLAQPSAGGAVLKKSVIMRKPTLRRPGEAAAPAAVESAPVAPAPVAPAPVAPPPAPSPAPAPEAAPAAVPVAEAPKLAAPVAKGIEISRQDAAKKMTARISLASATAQIPPVVAPTPAPVHAPTIATAESKTIKLRPPTVAPDPAALQRPAAELQTQAAKSKTSRISLEAALQAQPELPPAAPEQPKTIRLKRPSDMTGAPAKPALKPPTTHVSIPATPRQTGSIPSVAVPPPPADSEAPTLAPSPTRKMTIKVKRNGASSESASEGKGPKITINKGASADNGIGDESLQALSGFDNLAPVAAPDKVNPFFMVAAVLAIIVTINLIWVFMAQYFGPNAAASDFASLKGPDVGNPMGVMVVNE